MHSNSLVQSSTLGISTHFRNPSAALSVSWRLDTAPSAAALSQQSDRRLAAINNVSQRSVVQPLMSRALITSGRRLSAAAAVSCVKRKCLESLAELNALYSVINIIRAYHNILLR